MKSRFDARAFLSIFKTWKETFQSLSVNMFAVKSEDKWVVRYSSIVFMPLDKTDKLPDVFVKTENVMACRRTFSISADDVENFIANIEQSKIIIDCGDEVIQIDLADGYRPYYHPEHHPEHPSTERIPTLQYVKDYNFQSIDALFMDQELRMCDRPYEGLDDLLSELLIPQQYKYENRILLDLVIRAPIVLGEETKIEGNRANIIIVASPYINVANFKLGLRVLKENAAPDRLKINISEGEWKKENNLKVLYIEKELDAPLAAQAFLTYNNEPILRLWITDPNKSLNYRVAIHRRLDTSFNKLKKLLFPNKTESRNLEKGAAQLFWLHGFYVTHYGEKESIQEGPDLIIETPNGMMAAIECTILVSDIDQKLSKLTQRTQKVRKALDEAYRQDKTILPVLFTNMTQEELEPYMDKAANHEVAIATSENIDYFLQLLDLPMQPDTVFQELESLVHQKTQDMF